MTNKEKISKHPIYYNKVYKSANIQMNMNKRGNSRLDFLVKGNIVKSKRSQLTIFIIIAILLVAAILIIFYPRTKISASKIETPQDFIQSCMEQQDSVIEDILLNGGSLNPENFYLYKDIKVEYLCYTRENYKMCIMQQPILRQHVEEEISRVMKTKAEKCINDLALDYQKKGYTVSTKYPEVSTSIVPNTIKITLSSHVTLTKESSQSFDKFTFVKTSQAYNLIMIALSVLNWEARYGDAPTESYIALYPDLKIEKLKQGDGSKIYILTNIKTAEKFMFATRSKVIPPGYGLTPY